MVLIALDYDNKHRKQLNIGSVLKYSVVVYIKKNLLLGAKAIVLDPGPGGSPALHILLSSLLCNIHLIKKRLLIS